MTSQLRQRYVPITADFSRHYLPIHPLLLRIIYILKTVVFGVIYNETK
jgi:hypothetical protein